MEQMVLQQHQNQVYFHQMIMQQVSNVFIISISIKYIINLIIYVSWSANKTKDGSFVGKRDAPCGQARVFNKLLHPKNIQPPTTTGTNINSLEKSGHSSASAGFNYQPPHSTSLLVASLRSPGSDRLVNKEILLVSYCSDELFVQLVYHKIIETTVCYLFYYSQRSSALGGLSQREQEDGEWFV